MDKSKLFLEKIKKLNDKTGFLNLSKNKSQNKKGFKWVYSYNQHGKQITISNIHLCVLKHIVLSRNLPWEITSTDLAKKTMDLEKSCYPLYDEGFGILFLKIIKRPFHIFKGFWLYKFDNIELIDSSLNSLYGKVIKNNYPWIILNKKNADLAFEKNIDLDFEFGVSFVNILKNHKYHGIIRWCYIYKDENEYKYFVHDDLNRLKDIVLNNNFKWCIFDEILYKKAQDINKNNLNKLKHEKWAETGLYRVRKTKKSNVKPGFLWCYRFNKMGEKIELCSVNLLELQEKVIYNKFKWEIIDEKLAKKAFKENEKINSHYQGTGINGVYKIKNNNIIQGFTWVYGFSSNNKRKQISSNNLKQLKEKVLKKGFVWQIIDKDLAKKSFKENEKN